MQTLSKLFAHTAGRGDDYRPRRPYDFRKFFIALALPSAI